MVEFGDTADHYALLGHPVAHSLSPAIHHTFARQLDHWLVYETLDVTADALATALPEFMQRGKGANLTLPHKETALALLDEVTERARRAGAVNTVSHGAAGLCGDNTDGSGLLRDLQQNLGLELPGLRILLLGAGGAGRGVLAALLDLGIESLSIANRDMARAEHVLQDLDAEDVALLAYPDIREPFDLVINATSASLYGELPPLPGMLDLAGATAYDLVYASRATPFMHWAEGCGATQVCDGWGMVVEQAADSYEIWRGVRPDTTRLLNWHP